MSDRPSAVLRVFLTSPDALVRAGLVALLDSDEDVVVLEQADETVDAVIVDAAGDADVDIGDHSSAVVALCEHAEQARLMLADGASAVLSRSALGPTLVAATRAAAAGAVVIDPAFAEALLGATPGRTHAAGDTGDLEAVARTRESSSELPSVEALTPRENEVLALLAEGLSNREIAETLDISAHTAKFHVNAILDKLDARTRTEAVVRAARLGLLVL